MSLEKTKSLKLDVVVKNQNALDYIVNALKIRMNVLSFVVANVVIITVNIPK